MSSKDKASNAAQKIKGKAKEAAGAVTGDDELRAKGRSDQTKASAKDAGESVKDAVKGR